MTIPSLVWSQESFDYSGPLKVGEYEGNANFGYLLSGEDSLLNGSFEFYSADLNALLESGDRYFSIQGAFTNNIPSGYWQFEFGDFEKGISTVLRNNEYRVSINGINHSANGRMLKGRPDGTWTQTVHELNNSSVVSTPFESTIEFSSGIPQFSFRIRNQNATLVGRFLRDGLAHDRWELFSGSGSSESWVFSNGLLRSIEIKDGGLSRKIEVFPSGPGETTVINLDQRFMDLLALKRRLLMGTDSTYTSNIYALLRENTRYYNEIEKVLSQIAQSDFSPAYTVKVPYYPLTETEMVQLDSIQVFVQTAQAEAHAIEEDTQLQLLRLTDNEVGFLMTATEQINEALIGPLSLLVQFKEEGVLEYVERNEVLEMLQLVAEPEGTFEVNLEDSSRPIELASVPGWQGNRTAFNSAYSSAQSIRNTLSEMAVSLEQKLSLKAREEKLADLETDLIDAMSRLTDQTDSLTAEVLEPITSTISHVEEVARIHLKEYSELTDLSVKVKRASELISCFNDMYELNEVLAGLPEDQAAIKELYSDDVWNPFTLTVMDEEIKKRITSAYQDVLVPYILSTIRSELDCSNVCSQIKLIESINKRMEELLEEDTSKLERKLRREQDPQIVLELFEIRENS